MIRKILARCLRIAWLRHYRLDVCWNLSQTKSWMLYISASPSKEVATWKLTIEPFCALYTCYKRTKKLYLSKKTQLILWQVQKLRLFLFSIIFYYVAVKLWQINAIIIYFLINNTNLYFYIIMYNISLEI